MLIKEHAFGEIKFTSMYDCAIVFLCPYHLGWVSVKCGKVPGPAPGPTGPPP